MRLSKAETEKKPKVIEGSLDMKWGKSILMFSYVKKEV